MRRAVPCTLPLFVTFLLGSAVPCIRFHSGNSLIRSSKQRILDAMLLAAIAAVSRSQTDKESDP